MQLELPLLNKGGKQAVHKFWKASALMVVKLVFKRSTPQTLDAWERSVA
jgi:hypothetical protein